MTTKPAPRPTRDLTAQLAAHRAAGGHIVTPMAFMTGAHSAFRGPGGCSAYEGWVQYTDRVDLVRVTKPAPHTSITDSYTVVGSVPTGPTPVPDEESQP